MVKLKINTFKHGLLWYSCCEIPPENKEVFYYDNAPFELLFSPIVLHVRAFTYEKSIEKMNNKIKIYFERSKQ